MSPEQEQRRTRALVATGGRDTPTDGTAECIRESTVER